MFDGNSPFTTPVTTPAGGLRNHTIDYRGVATDEMDKDEFERHWPKIKQQLRARLGEDVFTSWFTRISVEGFDGGTIYLSVATRFLKSWIMSHYRDVLLELWQKEDSRIMRVDLHVRGAEQSALARQRAERTALDGGAPATAGHPGFVPGIGDMHAAMPQTVDENGLHAPLDPKYNFDTFMPGPSNALAHAAARQFASADPAERGNFNLLYIHGAVGLGKTHLLQAVAWEASRGRNRDQVVYLTADRFRHRFVSAVRNGEGLVFKDKLRPIELLIIDDMQFLQGKSTQQEFCHMLNSLLESGRRVMVAADRPPSELESLDERTRSRLSGGLVADVRPLGRSLRLAILRMRLEEARRRFPALDVSDKVLDYVADHVGGNGRELEGALNRLLAHNQLTNAQITLDMAEQAIRDLVKPSEPRRVRIEHIQRIVAKHFNISQQDILSERRNRSVVRPRQISMYLAKLMTDRSFPEIGRRFGGRDHTTVLHAVRKIEGMIQQDKSFADEVELLRRLVES